jgi:predicted  nucleic acid-binding Zn-ribbon protein
MTQCTHCGDYLNPARWNLGYRTCLDCGENQAIEQRKSWTVAPLHKSNYMLITTTELLHGLNNKGGLIK